MRPSEERLGLKGGHRDAGQVTSGRIDDETRHPGRLELGVEPIQALDLKPAGGKQQDSAPRSKKRSCTQTLAACEGRPEDRKVEGDAVDTQLGARPQRVHDQKLVDASI